MIRTAVFAFGVLMLAGLVLSADVVPNDSDSTPDVTPTIKPAPTAEPTTKPTAKPTTEPTTKPTTKPTTTIPTTKPTTAETTTKPKTTETTTQTTSKPTTTEKQSTTVTTLKTTTTVATTTVATTTTAIPEQSFYYNVTDQKDNKTYCILFKGSFTYSITYEAKDAKGKLVNNTVNVTTPEQPEVGATVSGSCGKTQFLKFDWAAKKNNIALGFKSADSTTWTLELVTAKILLDPNTFHNAVHANEYLSISTYFTLNPSNIPVNSSYSCVESVTSDNNTASLNDTHYGMKISSVLNQDFQLEAYNLVEQGNFTTATNCPVSTNSIIPIVVGCCLGGLVIIVLIAYIVSHRKRTAGYESTA